MYLGFAGAYLSALECTARLALLFSALFSIILALFVFLLTPNFDRDVL